MTRIRVLQVVVLASALGGIGAPNAFASTPTEAENQVATICAPGLSSDCIKGICRSVSSSPGWAQTDQTTFGAAVAGLIAKEGAADPSAADKIQSCIAKGPSALVTAFQGGGTPITDIGTQDPASPF
jgi:hypothetical protein